MNIEEILALSTDDNENILKQGISEERLKAILPDLRDRIAFYREYPDILIDHMKGPDSVFKFRFS